MKIPLDSHAVVRWLASPEKLTDKARALIADPANHLSVSAASIWELELKMDKGQLQMPAEFAEHLWDGGFGELPVRASHIGCFAKLPPIHKDPFDRILIAQAISEGMELMTRDREIHRYPAGPSAVVLTANAGNNIEKPLNHVPFGPAPFFLPPFFLHRLRRNRQLRMVEA